MARFWYRLLLLLLLLLLITPPPDGPHRCSRPTITDPAATAAAAAAAARASSLSASEAGLEEGSFRREARSRFLMKSLLTSNRPVGTRTRDEEDEEEGL